MQDPDRREFLKRTGAAATLAASAAFLAGCGPKTSTGGNSAAVQTQQHFEWKMATTWPPHFPVLGESADKLATWVETMSGGRLKIRVYGAGELLPGLGCFDAVSKGTIEMGHGASYYWAGKVPAAQFFSAVPFGMNAQQMNAWLYDGGGLELWEEVYAPFNLVPMPVGNTGVQMGGWFNREINSAGDLKGLKMRIPGLGGLVIDRAGGSVTLSAGGEIYTNLERGVIDATEWVGPYHDYKMGFYKIARYYYYPGWHEPGTVLEMFVNRQAFESLPPDLREIVRTAAARSNMRVLSELEAMNITYLRKMVDEEHIQLKRFPDEVLATFKRYTAEVLDELVASDPQSRKIHTSFQAFRQKVNGWADISEKAYYDTIAGRTAR